MEATSSYVEALIVIYGGAPDVNSTSDWWRHTHGVQKLHMEALVVIHGCALGVVWCKPTGLSQKIYTGHKIIYSRYTYDAHA